MFQKRQSEIVMFYNVENFFSPDKPVKQGWNPTFSGLRNWDDYKYTNKLNKIAHVFQLLKEKEDRMPMIVGLAEIQNDHVLEDLIKTQPFAGNFSYVHFNSLDERGVDVALLYDRTKLELINAEPISFFFEIDDDNPENYDTTRDVLWCIMKYQEEVIHFFVCHLPSKRERDINKPKRQYILSEIKKKAEDIIGNKKESVIICGDFNENPDEENLLDLVSGPGENHLLENPYLELYQNKNFSTFYNKTGLLFDQILLSNDFFKEDAALKFEKAEIFNSEKITTWKEKIRGRPFRTYAGTRYLGGYSDHFPVYISLLT